MALQASTLVNGAWTTTTYDVDQVLRAHAHEQESNLMDVEKPPTLGILTQTVIRSPLVHWILPVRLRGPKIHDVAFIGDDFVQIKELRPDGLLWDVVRKENFGTRVRNACVIGSVDAYKEDPDIRNVSPDVKDEDDATIPRSGKDSPGRKVIVGALPPQYLLLQLETGDSVFLMLHQSEDGKPELIASRYRVSKVMLDLQPGIHLAVDPSSRYMAIGCSEGVFAIYSLHSRAELKSQYADGKKLQYVKAEAYIYFTGLIIKMDFLYPSPDDEDHVILIALVVLKGKTRMLIWEWDRDNDLKHVHARSLKGYLVDQSRGLPQLLIPLRARSAFILICETSMAICEDILEGSPTFVDFNTKIDPPSPYHHGSGNPLWTAWARPSRYKKRMETTEDIYIVREDGIIKILEVDTSDASVTLDCIIGELDSNCGTAMTCLDCWMPQENGDLLVTGGDSGAGGTYLVRARDGPKYMEPIQNWSPAQDFVATFEGQDRDTGDRTAPKGYVPKPDRIFSCGGKGLNGAITEFRYGLEASIGLVMDYGASITQSWILYPDLESETGVSNFLMTVDDHSAVLLVQRGGNDVQELDEDATKFDLRFKTIGAAMQGSSMIQVTDRSIVVIGRSSFLAYEANELLEIHPKGSTSLGFGTNIWNAAIGENTIVFTTSLDGVVWLQCLVYKNFSSSLIDPEKGLVTTVGKFSLNSTGLAIATIASTLCAIVAEKNEVKIALSFVPLNGTSTKVVSINSTFGDRRQRIEEIVSIAVSSNEPGHLLLLCGTRNGIFITIELDDNTLEIIDCKIHKIGATTVLVMKDEYYPDLFFVNCDLMVYAVRPEMSMASANSPRRWLRQSKIHQVWLCDNAVPEYRPPKINSTARLRPNLSGGIGGSMLFVAGTQLLVARLSLQPKAVPRHLSIKCTPSRLMYSSMLNALVVAGTVNGKSTILFFDPDTGDNLSEPFNTKTKSTSEFIEGLGNNGERIFRLFEWIVKTDQNSWHYIIVGTSSGNVLVISIDGMAQISREIKNRSRIEQGDQREKMVRRSNIRYFMKHKFKGREPATAVIGFPDGIIRCVGNWIYCEALQKARKKFETVGKYQLPSPGINMSYSDGKLYVLTRSHSLEILQMVEKPNGYDLVRTHADAVSRAALHHTIIDHPTTRPIHLISDKMCSIVGLWPTEDTKADMLEPVFEAQLPFSILRFRFARCRPIWDPVWSTTNRVVNPTSSGQVLALENIPNSTTHSETLGLSISGALSHYTILNAPTFEFLRFLMELAIRSLDVCEFTFKDTPIPLGYQLPNSGSKSKIGMHVDGDILRSCLDLRVLEGLLKMHADTRESRIIFQQFVSLLQALHEGTLPKDKGKEVYVEQAYVDLAFLLRPVM